MDKHGSLPLHFPVQCSRKSASRVCAGLVCKGLGFPTLTLSARSPVLFGMALLQFLCLHQFCPQSNKANYRRGVPPPPIFIPLPVAGMEWERLWSCFLSLCNVPLQDRDVGHSCPVPLVNNQRVFYWFRRKFGLRTLSSFPALWCQCQACGTSLSTAVKKGSR